MSSELQKSNYGVLKDVTFLSLSIITIFAGLVVFYGESYVGKEYFHLLEKSFKLLLACLTGSVIGLERGNKKRPAGLRTNALVCVGSTLIMIISFEIFDEYHELANFDPARLGAQVISGIGFLGAGTIMRNDMHVKGLTTAASLWVVAALGLAIGTGYYFEAIATCGIVYFTLHHLGNLEHRRMIKKEYTKFTIVTENKAGQIGLIGQTFGKHGIKISNFFFDNEDDADCEHCDEGFVNVILTTMLPFGLLKKQIEAELLDLDGIISVKSIIS